ncbi:MAG TPA: carbohydrate binding domain-containing protein [Pseudonocardiaceae bacterium]|nr:carbohydrate binding domain-containing protein [Pseudonocardiaceae bacterium]
MTNPGFETGLAGWTCTGGTTTVSTPVHSGSAALAGTPAGQDFAQCSQVVSVVANSSYTLTAFVQGSYVYLGDTGTGTTDTNTWTPSATTWQQLSTTFTTGASTTSVTVYLHGWYGQPTYNADDVVLSGPAGSGGGGPTVPPAPTGLTVTGVTPSSASLSWSAATGATGYNVYQNGTKVSSVTSTSATVSGLASSSSFTFAVTATNSAGESPKSASVTANTPAAGGGGGGGTGPEPGFGPYIDITRGTPLLQDIAKATGQKYFTLAFILGDSTGCDPSWGGTIPLTDSGILGQISALRAMGGDVAVSFGGAQGPYLNQTCSTQASLTTAIEKVMDTLSVHHLDFDIEASVPIDPMNKAIAQIQRDRPGTTVRYTLEVLADSFGLINSLGTDVLSNAVGDGVQVTTVNPMLMDFSSSGEEWGQAVIQASQSVLKQMAVIWPGRSGAQLNKMFGGTVMIGDNDTGPVFSTGDGNAFISWANSNHIGFVSFWSVGRDNGGCSGGVSPACSGVSQSQYQFTSIFRGFTG